MEHSLCPLSCAWRSESNRQRIYVNILPRQNTDRRNLCFLYLLLSWDGGGVTEDYLMNYPPASACIN